MLPDEPFIELKMKTIEANTQISKDRILVLQLPLSILPGEHHIVVMIDEKPVQIKPKAIQPAFKWKRFAWKTKMQDCTFRREDLYDDYGR